MHRVRSTTNTAEQRRGSRGLRRFSALLLLLPTVAVQAATANPADAAVVAGFEIDGNTTVDGGGLDWATTGTRTPDPTGNVDDSNFTGGSKEFQNPSAWKEGTGTSTNQGDISDVYSHFATGTESWGLLGFRRIAQSGTMTFMVEFNQKANLPQQADDSVQFRPDRTVNDLLLRFEQDGNGNFALTHAYKWTQSAGGSFASGCFQVPGYTTPSAWCPTSTAGSGFAGATGENKLFAEAAVNLSSFDSVGDCRGAFGVMNVRSFAGDSESSSLLDFVGGIGISVPPTCGSLVINKVDQFKNPVAGATFTITPNPIPGVTGDAAKELVVKEGSTPGIDTVADGTITISPAKPGTYKVVESKTPSDQYILDATVHDDVVVGSSGTSVATVEFTNPLTFKPLDVDNTAAGSYGVEYDWLVHKSVVGDAKKTIEEGATTTFRYQVELEALPQGAPSNKSISGTMTVTNPNPAGYPAMRTTLALSGDVACTFSPSNAAIDVDAATPGVQVDAASASSKGYAYTCTPPAGELVSGKTKARASWDQATYPQVPAHPGYDEAEATYAITVQPKIDEYASVYDTFGTDATVQIGQSSYKWSDVYGAAGSSHKVVVATYDSLPLGGVAGTCKTYDNTAKVVEKDTLELDESSARVEVCVDLDDLVVTKTASPSFAREWDWVIEKSVKGARSQTVEEGAQASFEYDVVVTPTKKGDTSFVVSGVITVDNPNATTISGVTLTDTLPGASCTIDKPAGLLTVPKGKSTFDYSCTLPNATASTTGTNTATATWDASKYYGTSGSAMGSAPFDFAKATVSETDETATVTDTQVDLDGVAPDGVVLKAADGAKTFSYTKEFDGVPGACKTYDNTAKVVEADTLQSDDDTESVQVCTDLDDLVVTKTANPKFARDYDWTIEKSVDGASSQTVPQGMPASFEYDVVVTPSAPKDGKFVVSGVITVQNPNETTISGVTLTDTLPGGTCTVNKPAGLLTIPKGTSTFAYSCELPGATATTKGTNTATATWDASTYYGTDGSATGTKSFDFADAQKVVTDQTATVTDTQIDLDDEVPGGAVVEAGDGPRTFTYTKEFDGVPGACKTYDNTAKVVEHDSYDSDSDTETVEVCVEKPLVPTVSGSADLARAYAWSIAKVADATQRTVDGSGNATFTYTVTAKAGAATDSGWQVKGSVTIANPNEYADGDITADVTAATTLGGGSVCTVTGGNDVVIADDSSVTLPIACTFSSQPASSGSLDVTATWDPAGAATSASAKASTPVAFTVRSETDKTVQVVDDKTVAGQRVVLDPALTWAAGLVKSYTYSLALRGGAPGSCQSWTNTATIDLPVGTDQTASAVVLACTPAPEVLPEQSFGKAVGSVKASCQGTVRAKLSNRSGETVTYKLRVGKKVHTIVVKAQAKKKFVTKGKPFAKVTLKVGSTKLDKLRIPGLCQAPEVLPDTGLRGASE
jgi:hypothetical protein